MQLISLELKNIRSYTKETIYFTNSMLLVGDIGSGKSTILQAVEFALFGIQRGLQDANHLLKNGEEDGEVSLTFKLDKEITVTRGLKRNKSVAQTPGKLVIDGEEELFAPSELKAKVLELLGYPESSTKAQSLIFRYTVYASQEQMKSIILERPETRLDTLRVIFGIDKYKQVISNAQIYMRQLKKEITYLDGRLENLTQLKANLAELKVSKNTISEKVQVQEKELINLKDIFLIKKNSLDESYERAKETQSKKDKLQFIQQQKADVSNKIEKLFSQKSSLEKELLLLKDVIKPVTVDDKEKQLQEEQDLYQRNTVLQSSLHSKKSALTEKLSDILEQRKDLEQTSNDDLADKKIELEKRIHTFNKSLDHINTKEKEFTLLQSKKETITSLLHEKQQQKSAFSALSSCPMCKQDVPHSHKESITSDLDKEISLKEKELTFVTKELKNLHEVIAPKGDFQERVQSLQQSLSKLEVQIEQNSRSTQKIKELGIKEKETKDELEKVLKKLHVIEQYSFDSAKQIISALQKEISDAKNTAIEYEKKQGLEKQLKSVNEQLSDNKVSLQSCAKEEKQLQESIDVSILDNHATLKTEFEELQKSYNGAQITCSNTKKDLEYADKQIVAVEKEVKQKEQAKKEQTWKIHFKNWLTDYFVPLQKDIESEVLSYIYEEFSELFTKWFSILLEDDAFSVTLDSQFTPIIQLQGYDISIDSLSGGERTSVALAYRLALNHIVNKLIGLETRDILILDEPTEGFSTEQLDRVRDVLDQLDVPQLLIVSHEQKLDGFVDDVVRIEKGVEGSYLSTT